MARETLKGKNREDDKGFASVRVQPTKANLERRPGNICDIYDNFKVFGWTGRCLVCELAVIDHGTRFCSFSAL